MRGRAAVGERWDWQEAWAGQIVGALFLIEILLWVLFYVA